MDTLSRLDRHQDDIVVALGRFLLLVLGVLVILHLRDVVMSQVMVTTIEAEILPVVALLMTGAEAVAMNIANAALEPDVAAARHHQEIMTRASCLRERNGSSMIPQLAKITSRVFSHS
jgi:hypothetical protein